MSRIAKCAVIALVILGIVSLRWFFGCLVPYWRTSPEAAASLGDTFGALNALFSGLAFGGVLVALILQQQEFRKSFEAVQKTAEAQQAQAESLLLSAYLQGLTTVYQSKMKNKALEEIEKMTESLRGRAAGIMAQLRTAAEEQ